MNLRLKNRHGAIGVLVFPVDPSLRLFTEIHLFVILVIQRQQNQVIDIETRGNLRYEWSAFLCVSF
jgi:hypothetical protein